MQKYNLSSKWTNISVEYRGHYFFNDTPGCRINMNVLIRVSPYQYGDVVAFGNHGLDVEMLPQLFKVAKPQDAASEIAPHRVELGTVNQAIALHNFIHNIFYLNQCVPLVLHYRSVTYLQLQ